MSNCEGGGMAAVEYGAGRALAKMSLKLLFRSTTGVGYGGGRPVCRFDALAGSVGATMTRYCVCLSCCDRPTGMKVCVVKGCRSRIVTSSNCLLWFASPSSFSSRARSPHELGMLSLGSLLRRFRGEHTNMFITAFAGFLDGARLYKLDICVTSRYFRAEPWLA